MEKIFCIGFPKTGTTSLEEALKKLGYTVCKGHYNNNHSNYLISLFLHRDYDELDRIVNYFDAFCDLPWGGTDFYLYLSKKYPNAKFIHTTRNPEKWYESLEHMLTEFDDNLDIALDVFHQKTRYGAVYYIKREFKIQKLSGNKEKIISHYKKRNDDIVKYFKEKLGLYLKIDLSSGNSWKELCAFLNKEIPKTPFPHLNIAFTKDNGTLKKNEKINFKTTQTRRYLKMLKKVVYKYIKI